MAQCCVPCGKLTAWHGKAPTTRCHNTPIKYKTTCVCVGCQKHSLVCVVLACSAAPSALLVSPPSWQSVGHVDGWLCVLMHTHHQPPNTLVPHNTHAPWACSHTTHKSHHPLCGVLLLLFSNGTNCGWFVVHGQGARCGWSSITKHHIHTTTTMQHTWCGCGDDQCDLLLVPHHHITTTNASTLVGDGDGIRPTTKACATLHEHTQCKHTRVMALNLHEPCSPVPDVVVPRACAPVVALVLLFCWCFVRVGFMGVQ